MCAAASGAWSAWRASSSFGELADGSCSVRQHATRRMLHSACRLPRSLPVHSAWASPAVSGARSCGLGSGSCSQASTAVACAVQHRDTHMQRATNWLALSFPPDLLPQPAALPIPRCWRRRHARCNLQTDAGRCVRPRVGGAGVGQPAHNSQAGQRGAGTRDRDGDALQALGVEEPPAAQPRAAARMHLRCAGQHVMHAHPPLP